MSRFDELRARVRLLEDDLEAEAQRLRAQLSERMANGRERFRSEVRARQRELRRGLLPYILGARAAHLLTAPLVYALIVPLLMLDLAFTVYQQVCFRAWGIERVRRADYFRFDRHRLGYLNLVEKLNCHYCAYGNGLLAYAREVAGRTEQYWCPVRHATSAASPHRQYHHFVAYGDAESYQRELPILRRDLGRN